MPKNLKGLLNKKTKSEYPPGAEADMKKLYKHKAPSNKEMNQMAKHYNAESRLSAAEKRDREDIVKGMKKNKTDFMKRYGRDHEAVMYATATKLAQNEENINELSTDLINKVAKQRRINTHSAYTKHDDHRDPEYKKAAEKQKRNEKLTFSAGARKIGQFQKSLSKSLNKEERVPGDNVKHQMRPKGMSAGEAGKRKLAKVAQGDKNRKLANESEMKRLGDAVSKLKKTSDEFKKASNRYLMSKGKFSADHSTPEQKKKSMDFLKKYNKDAANRRKEENKGLPKGKQWDRDQIKKDLGEGSYDEFKKDKMSKYGKEGYKNSSSFKRGHEEERRRIKKEYGKGSKQYDNHMKDINELELNEDERKKEFKYARTGADYSKSGHASDGHELHQGGDRGGLTFSGKHPSGHSYTTTDHKSDKKAIHKAVKNHNPHLSKDDHKTIANDIHRHVSNMEENFINELDKSTLKSYVGKAQAERLHNIDKMEKESKRGESIRAASATKKVMKRGLGIRQAQKKLGEAEFDSEKPKRGIQRKRVNLQFGRQQRYKPSPFKKDQQQDLYKKDDSLETKIKKSKADNRFPDYRQNKDTGKIKSDFVPGGKHVKKYGGVKNKKTAPNVTSTTEDKVINQLQTLILEKKSLASEDLRDWFKDKWVRMDTKGNIKGDCAREPGEGKPKCLPQSKAHSMSKADRGKAARRKRRQDPVADRPGKGGKPINVKTEERVDEKCWDGWKQQGMKKKGKKIVPNCVKENFKDGKNPQDKGDSKRHGLSGKQSTSSLKKVRSSDSASPRKKQLAHWLLNMRKGRNKKK